MDRARHGVSVGILVLCVEFDRREKDSEAVAVSKWLVMFEGVVIFTIY